MAEQLAPTKGAAPFEPLSASEPRKSHYANRENSNYTAAPSDRMVFGIRTSIEAWFNYGIGGRRGHVR